MRVTKTVTTVEYDVSITAQEALAIIAALRCTQKESNKSVLQREQGHLLDVFVDMVGT